MIEPGTFISFKCKHVPFNVSELHCSVAKLQDRFLMKINDLTFFLPMNQLKKEKKHSNLKFVITAALKRVT